jgi:hypothetical protein
MSHYRRRGPGAIIPLSFGGSWQSYILTASLSWQEYFTVTGFRSLPAASLSFQLPHSLSISATFVAGRFQVYGGTFLGASFAPYASSPLHHGKLKDYVPEDTPIT